MDEQHVSEEAPAGTASFAGMADRMMNACAVEVSAEAFRGELLRSEMELVGALYGVIWHPRQDDGNLDAIELAAGIGAEAVQLWRIPLSKLAVKVLTEGGHLVQQIGEPADRLLSGVRYVAMGMPVPGGDEPAGALTMVVREDQGMWQGRGAASAHVLANFGLLHAVDRSRQIYRRYYEDISRVWDLIGEAMAYDDAEKMAQVLANGARGVFEVMRVTVGFTKADRVKIAAISDEDAFDKRGNVVHALREAQEEAVAQQKTVSFSPAASEETQSVPAHSRLCAEGTFKGGVLTVPLRCSDETVGAWTFECDADKGLSQDRQKLIQITSGQIGPLLAMALRRGRGAWERTADSTRKLGGFLLSAEHPYRRVFAVLAACALVFLIVGKATLRLRGKCVLEPTILRTYCAPFDSTLSDVAVVPPARVRKGDVLVELDREDVELALREAQSGKVRVEKQMDIYLSEAKISEFNVASAELDQLIAKIDMLKKRRVQATVRAEFDGIVLSGDLRQLVGSPVKTGDRLMEVAPLEELTLLVELAEEDVPFAALGQRGVFVTKARPDVRLAFEVEKIRPSSEVRSGRNVFVVESHVDNSEGWLLPGMQGIAKIESRKGNVAWVYSRRLVNWLRMHIWW